MLLALALLLSGCQYAVVEQQDQLEGAQTGRKIWVAAPAEEDPDDPEEDTKEGAEPEKGAAATAAPAPVVTVKPTATPTQAPTATPEPAYTVLQDGSSGDAVKALQTRLKVLGFLEGEADGVYGAMTEQAVRDVQAYLVHLEIEQLPAAVLAGTATPDATEAPAPTPTPLPEVSEEIANGVADEELQQLLLEGSFDTFREVLQVGSKGDETVRLQRRLKSLDYTWDVVDGAFGAKTQTAVSEFQKRNKLEQTGIADQLTQELLYSEEAIKAEKPPMPYEIRVSVDDQRVYVYSWGSDGSYSNLVKKFVCSTGLKGTPTPKGTFTNTGPGARWHYFKKFKCWAQYAYYIDGDIMFHSVLYNRKGGGLSKSSVRNLGRRASHGCVRLAVEDCKWLYMNCPAGTKVIVY